MNPLTKQYVFLNNTKVRYTYTIYNIYAHSYTYELTTNKTTYINIYIFSLFIL